MITYKTSIVRVVNDMATTSSQLQVRTEQRRWLTTRHSKKKYIYRKRSKAPSVAQYAEWNDFSSSCRDLDPSSLAVRSHLPFPRTLCGDLAAHVIPPQTSILWIKIGFLD